MSTKHTPGPWEYEGGWLYHHGRSSTGAGYSDTILKIDDPVWRPTDADARLIAAAPEMLKELKAGLRFAREIRSALVLMGHTDTVQLALCDTRVDDLLAVIAKAEA